jgi:drug/metabolite transporter (DMT)-like permease
VSRPHQGVGLLIAAFVGLAYGSSLVFARLSYDHGTTFFTIIALRYLVLTVVLAVWLRVRGLTLLVPRRLAIRSALIGAIALTTSIAYLASIAYIPVSLATLVFYTHPLLTAVLAGVLLGIRSTRMEIIASVAAFAGLGLVLQVSFDSLHPLGLAFGLFASVSAAIVFILSAPVISAIGSLRFTFYLALTGAGFGCLIAGLTQSVVFPVTGLGWSLLSATVLLNVFGLLGMFVSVRMLGPVATPMVLNLEPITAITLAVIVLGEHLSIAQVGGTAVVIVAILAAQSSRARSQRGSKP